MPRLDLDLQSPAADVIDAPHRLEPGGLECQHLFDDLGERVRIVCVTPALLMCRVARTSDASIPLQYHAEQEADVDHRQDA
jgi:hypothetical protein